MTSGRKNQRFLQKIAGKDLVRLNTRFLPEGRLLYTPENQKACASRRALLQAMGRGAHSGRARSLMRRGPRPDRTGGAIHRLHSPGGDRAGHCGGHYPGNRHPVPSWKASQLYSGSSGRPRSLSLPAALPPESSGPRFAAYAQCLAAWADYPRHRYPPGILRRLCRCRLWHSLHDRH